jgi:hypothetical protein
MRDEVPLRRTAFGRRNMVADARLWRDVVEGGSGRSEGVEKDHKHRWGTTNARRLVLVRCDGRVQEKVNGKGWCGFFSATLV